MAVQNFYQSSTSSLTVIAQADLYVTASIRNAIASMKLNNHYIAPIFAVKLRHYTTFCFESEQSLFFAKQIFKTHSSRRKLFSYSTPRLFSSYSW